MEQLLPPLSQVELLQNRIRELETKLQEKTVGPQRKAFWDLVRVFIFELMGTTIFAYGIVSSRGSDYLISAYLYAGIYLSAKFSGGHVNPAVSLSFYASNEIDALTMRIYWIAQGLGAFIGAIFAYAVLGDIGSPAISDPTVSWLFADFCGEVIGTFAFVLFIHIQVHPQTALTDNDVIGIGIIVAGLFFGRMLTFHSGGALNPAMGVSLAIFRSIKDQNYQRLADCWVFVFGPILGAQLASEFYRNVYLYFLPKPEKEEQEYYKELEDQ